MGSTGHWRSNSCTCAYKPIDILNDSPKTSLQAVNRHWKILFELPGGPRVRAKPRRHWRDSFRAQSEKVRERAAGLASSAEMSPDRKGYSAAGKQIALSRQRERSYSQSWNREKALKVLGLSEDDVELSLRFFVPRRQLYGGYQPRTRTTVIMRTLRHFICQTALCELVVSYALVPTRRTVADKAMRLLGAKPGSLARYKALRLLGYSNQEVEETNARYLARLGRSVSFSYDDSVEMLDQPCFCAFASSESLSSGTSVL